MRWLFRARRALDRSARLMAIGAAIGASPRVVAAVGFAATLLTTGMPRDASAAAPGIRTIAIRITSPLGRTGLAGPIRIVAQVQHPEKARLQPVKFYVDQQLFGQ